MRWIRLIALSWTFDSSSDVETTKKSGVILHCAGLLQTTNL